MASLNLNGRVLEYPDGFSEDEAKSQFLGKAMRLAMRQPEVVTGVTKIVVSTEDDLISFFGSNEQLLLQSTLSEVQAVPVSSEKKEGGVTHLGPPTPAISGPT